MGDVAARAPSGLGKAGRALWRQITGSYQLDPRESAYLEAAARQADVVAGLEAAMVDASLVVKGSQGQPVVNSLLTEARMGRLATARLLGQLGLPSGDERPMTAKQLQAQRAAQSRWQRTAQSRARRTSGAAS